MVMAARGPRIRQLRSLQQRLFIQVSVRDNKMNSWQNRFGNIDVQSSFTACLEKGQEIKDNVFDFYFLHAAENQLR